MKIEESELRSLKSEEIFTLRRKYSETKDIESLLTIAKFRFQTGSIATNKNTLPEMCYYFGRLKKTEELSLLLQEKNFYLTMLPESSLILAENLLNIGLKFPNLSEEEISYLEENYCDTKTFELFDVIMFDKELLPRQIKKFDKELLNRKNTEFSDEFLIRLFDCFLENEEIDDRYYEIFVYSRISNKVFKKMYEDIGLGEYCIVQPIKSNQFWKLIENRFGEKCADDLNKKLCYVDNFEDFKKQNFFNLNPQDLERTVRDYFNNQETRNEVKILVAKSWLDEINKYEIRII